MTHFWKKNTFWAKTSLSFVFREPNSEHSEVFRCDVHNDTSFKAVWWSISEKKTHFRIKHHFSLYLEGQTQCTLSFSAMPIAIVQVYKLYDDLFLNTTHFGLKHHFSFYLDGQTQCTLRFWGMMIPVVQVSKLYDDLFLRKHILG